MPLSVSGVPAPPYDLPLNTTMQTIATVVLWGATAALLAYTVVLARRERSPLPVLLVLAAATGSVFEPIYDIGYHLHWLDAGEQWTLFTAFGLPQPVWVMPAYVMVFGFPAVLTYRAFAAGTTTKKVFRMAGILTVTTALFEITATNLDLYTYYGDAPLRVLRYPLYIGWMEGVQITGYAVLAAVLARRATRPVHLLAVFALFPANFAFDVMGAGFPIVIAQNSSTSPSQALMVPAALLAMALAATTLWWTAQLLVHRDADAVTAPAAPVRESVSA